MFNRHESTKKQGDAGMGLAIGWMTSHGITVSVPLTDSQDYDLIADDGTGLCRVQVKTTTYKTPCGVYQANLSVKGGNRTGTGRVKKFDKGKVDKVFVVVGDGGMFFIPADKVGCHGLNLGVKYDSYKVNW